MNPKCGHEVATTKFESHYQQHPLVGNESQFRCSCGEAVKVSHKDYEPGGPKAIRLVPTAVLKQTVAAAPKPAAKAKPAAKKKGKK